MNKGEELKKAKVEAGMEVYCPKCNYAEREVIEYIMTSDKKKVCSWDGTELIKRPISHSKHTMFCPNEKCENRNGTSNKLNSQKGHLCPTCFSVLKNNK